MFPNENYIQLGASLVSFIDREGALKAYGRHVKGRIEDLRFETSEALVKDIKTDLERVKDLNLHLGFVIQSEHPLEVGYTLPNGTELYGGTWISFNYDKYLGVLMYTFDKDGNFVHLETYED